LLKNTPTPNDDIDRSQGFVYCPLQTVDEKRKIDEETQVPRPTQDDRAAAVEFRASPHGRHGPALQALLDRFRHEPFPEKHVLICTRPHREWVLALWSGVRGVAPRPLPGPVFRSTGEAEWEVFKRRWARHFGEDLE
jgi:hypothetical protein